MNHCSAPLLLTMALFPAGLMAQQSAAILHAPLVVTAVDGPPLQALGDFDGDGDLDAIGSRVHPAQNAVEVVVWPNAGGAFGAPVAVPLPFQAVAGPAPRSLAFAVADLDQDGRDDFVVRDGAGVVLGRATPGLLFQFQIVALPGAPRAHAVAIGQLDGDNLPDIAVAYVDQQSALRLSVLRSTAGPLHAQVAITPGSVPRVLAAELDDQSGDELLVSDERTGDAWLYGVAAGQLALLAPVTHALTGPGAATWHWTAGDVDGDQRDDLVVFRPGDGSLPARYQLLRRTGPVAFAATPTRAGGPAQRLFDVDGDGDLDGVGSTGAPSPVAGAWPRLDFESTFTIAPNHGNGSFAPAWRVPVAGATRLAGAADVDADGDVDLVAGRCVFYGRGPLRSEPTPLAGGPDARTDARSWQLHDLDRDGDLDLATNRNRGDGAMTPRSQVVAPPAGHVFVGGFEVDVDGDGARDRIVQLRAGSSAQQSTFVAMALLQNNGGGHFHYRGPVAANGSSFGPATATANFGPDSSRAADCDGDGDEDLIWTSDPARGEGFAASIHWNQGAHQSGQFVAGPSFTAATGGRIEAVADFDGDGHPDLLTSDGLAVHVLRGGGPATQPFASAWSGPAMPFEPAAIVVADLDDDGRLDFARPDHAGQIVLFVNRTPVAGPLQFVATRLAGVTLTVRDIVTGPRATLTATDLDADGRTDLVAGGLAGEPGTSVVLRRSAWSDPPTLADYDVTRQAFAGGFACDIDGDGDEDLVLDRATHGARFHGRRGGMRLQKFEGTVGEAGAVPVLGGTGPYRITLTDVMRLTGVPGPTLSIMGLALREADLPDQPRPGLHLRLDPSLMLVVWWPVPTNGQGRAAAIATLPSFIMPGFAGVTFYAQVFVVDAAAPSGFTQTNVLEKRIGW